MYIYERFLKSVEKKSCAIVKVQFVILIGCNLFLVKSCKQDNHLFYSSFSVVFAGNQPIGYCQNGVKSKRL